MYKMLLKNIGKKSDGFPTFRLKSVGFLRWKVSRSGDANTTYYAQASEASACESFVIERAKKEVQVGKMIYACAKKFLSL